MKMIIAIVSNDDANKVQKALVEHKFFATRLATTGGFLRARNSTFLIGVNDEKVPQVLEIIENHSKSELKWFQIRLLMNLVHIVLFNWSWNWWCNGLCFKRRPIHQNLNCLHKLLFMLQ